MLIQKALARYDGNVSHAAQALGLVAQRALPPPRELWPLTRRGERRATADRGDALAHHERLVFRLALLAGLPGVVVVAGAALARRLQRQGAVDARRSSSSARWLIAALVLRERVVRPLQTLSNLLAALREGDYSIRARGAERDDALGLALLEVEPARRDAARAAPRRAGSDGAAAHA